MSSVFASRRSSIVAVLVLALAAVPATASAVTITLGPKPLPAPTNQLGCDGLECNDTWVQRSSPDFGTAAPADGTITVWRVKGSTDPSYPLCLRVVRPQSGGTYLGVASSAGATATDGSAITTSLAVQAGDLIGADTVHTGPMGQTAPTVGYVMGSGAIRDFNPFLSDGSSATGSDLGSPAVMSLNADVELAVPSVTSVSPGTGSTAGGYAVTIAGQHLAGASQVLFGSTPATISSNTNSEITVTAPPHDAGTVNVTVTAPGGTSAAAPENQFVYAAPDNGGGGPGGGSSQDTTAPVISAFILSPTTFIAANSGPSVVAATAVGTRVLYRLSEPATTTLTAERRARGIKKRGRCVAGRPGRGKKRCTRYVSVKGSATHADVAGLNTFRFMGRLRGKELKPGRYRLVAVASDQAGNRSKPARGSFRIKR